MAGIGSNFIIAHGLGGKLLITKGLGATSEAQVDDSPPAGHISDHVQRGKDLFITQFRQLRDDLV